MSNFSPFWNNLLAPSPLKPRIGFSDASDPRVIQAIADLFPHNLYIPCLIGERAEIDAVLSINKQYSVLAKCIAPSLTKDSVRSYVALLNEHSRRKEVVVDDSVMNDSLIRGIAMLLNGEIDGLVAGSLRSTADIVKASLLYIGPKAGIKVVSGQFFIESPSFSSPSGTPYLFTDCAVVPEPSASMLALIAASAAESFSFFTGEKPKIAFLSFSTRGSAEHELVSRTREALEIFKRKNPDISADGEVQVDAAMDKNVAKIKRFDDSLLSGVANIFLFPTLESGNISYKLVQRFSSARVAGPILWGLRKPVSDLSRGCNIQEVKDTILCVRKMCQGAV